MLRGMKFKLDTLDEVGVSNANLPDFLPIFERGIMVIKDAFENHPKGKNIGKLRGVDFGLGGTVNLVLIDDQSIRKINKKYRGKDMATDVVTLSYADGEKFPGEDLVGEIFISVDTAARQAKEFGNSLKEEIAYLFTHGLLHVFGYDHANEEERERMFKLQEEILGG